MRLDKKGEDFIKQEEGFSLKAYKDTGGVWTILWGFTYSPITGKAVTKDTVLTLADAEIWWEKGIKPFEDLVTSIFANTKAKLTQNNFNALVSLCWNIGKNGLSTSTLVNRIKILAEYSNAIPEFAKKDSISYWFLVWHMDNGEINTSLLARRKREIILYFS